MGEGRASGVYQGRGPRDQPRDRRFEDAEGASARRFGHEGATHRQHLSLAARQRTGHLLAPLLQARKERVHWLHLIQVVLLASPLAPVGAQQRLRGAQSAVAERGLGRSGGAWGKRGLELLSAQRWRA
jgi:hypothetical protein